MDFMKLHDIIDCELDKIGNDPKGLNPAALSNLTELVDAKKDLLEIEEKEMMLSQGEAEPSYRRASYGYTTPSYRRSSYGYGVDMPRTSMHRNGESGSDSYAHLEEALRTAQSEPEREAIRQLMSKLYK